MLPPCRRRPAAGAFGSSISLRRGRGKQVSDVTGRWCRAAPTVRTRAVILSKHRSAPSPMEEITMRNALVTTRLLDQARAAADAEADQRHEHQAQVDAPPEDEPEPGRLATVATLARRARALAARAT
jgi:hypothetical protein